MERQCGTRIFHARSALTIAIHSLGKSISREFSFKAAAIDQQFRRSALRKAAWRNSHSSESGLPIGFLSSRQRKRGPPREPLDHSRPRAESHQCTTASESVGSGPQATLLHTDVSLSNVELASRLAILNHCAPGDLMNDAGWKRVKRLEKPCVFSHYLRGYLRCPDSWSGTPSAR